MSAVTMVMTEQEFDEQYSELFGRLTRLARALGAGLDAEDVAQETLVTGRRSLGQLRDDSRLEAWLRTSLVRLVRRRRPPVRLYIRDSEMAFVPLDPIAGLDLAAAVAALPRREHDALALVYGLGYSQDEAAEAMGITRGAVAAHLFKARRRLARDIEIGD